MVLKPSSRYGERFGKQMKCVGLLVVEKTWLMCPDKATVGFPSATAKFKCLKTYGSQFLEFWLKGWLLNHYLGMGNGLQKEWSGFYGENCTFVTFHGSRVHPNLVNFWYFGLVLAM